MNCHKIKTTRKAPPRLSKPRPILHTPHRHSTQRVAKPFNTQNKLAPSTPSKPPLDDPQNSSTTVIANTLNQVLRDRGLMPKPKSDPPPKPPKVKIPDLHPPLPRAVKIGVDKPTNTKTTPLREPKARLLTERQKMTDGLPYDAKHSSLRRVRSRSKQLGLEFAQTPLPYSKVDGNSHKSLRRQLLPHAHATAYVIAPITCDYGFNVFVGQKSFINAGCTFLDAAPIRIGNNVMIGPNVDMYSTTHHTSFLKRREGYCIGKEIVIGDDCWIGGRAVINPGIKIGNRTIIGAGSVVTNDIPSDVFAAGNPARIIKYFDNVNFDPQREFPQAVSVETWGELQEELNKGLISPPGKKFPPVSTQSSLNEEADYDDDNDDGENFGSSGDHEDESDGSSHTRKITSQIGLNRDYDLDVLSSDTYGIYSEGVHSGKTIQADNFSHLPTNERLMRDRLGQVGIEQ